MIIIKRQGDNAMDYRRALPFYHAYPQYDNWNQLDEDRVVQDLEYLQQMYPASARRYQVRIAQMLDRMDYDGSMIYDAYPDQFMLRRLSAKVKNRRLQGRMHRMMQNGPGSGSWSQCWYIMKYSKDVIKKRIIIYFKCI